MIALTVVCSLFVGVGAASAYTVWNASQSAYPTTNPNGVWTYGFKLANADGSIGALENANVGGPCGFNTLLYQWERYGDSCPGYHGWITFNTGSSAYTTAWGVYWAPNGIDMHPGQPITGEGGVILSASPTIRWTSPISDWVTVDASFAIYSGWGAPSGFVMHNEQTIYSVDMVGDATPGHVVGSPPYLPYGSFSQNVFVNAGDTLDITLTDGIDNNWGGDATGITFRVTVPEPSSLLALGMGAMSLVGLIRRKRS